MPTSAKAAGAESTAEHLAQLPAAIRQAFAIFLGIPTAVVCGFSVLAVAAYLIDLGDLGGQQALTRWLQSHIFADAEATTQVLGAMAGGLFTVASITFSLLLVALQQSAGSMTYAVFGQFLRRKQHQLYAGWFIGITLFTLVTLATVRPDFNPILGATLSLLFAATALYVLLMIYSIIDQMRPADTAPPVLGADGQRVDFRVARTERIGVVGTIMEPNGRVADRLPCALGHQDERLSGGQPGVVLVATPLPRQRLVFEVRPRADAPVMTVERQPEASHLREPIFPPRR